jgi:DNA-binding transcriptional LysR family regulator
MTIGADAAVHVLPLIGAFRARYPRIKLSVISGNSQRLMQQLDRFEIDFAVVAEAPPSAHYEARLLTEDRLAAFVPRTHPLARRRRIAFAKLAEATLILREPGSVTRRLVEEELARRGLAISDVIEVESREGAREAVAQGLGIGVVSAGEFVGEPRLARIGFADWEAVMCEWLVCLAARTGLKMISAMLEIADGHGATKQSRP